MGLVLLFAVAVDVDVVIFIRLDPLNLFLFLHHKFVWCNVEIRLYVQIH